MKHTHINHRSPWVIDMGSAGLSKRDGPGLLHPLQLHAPAPGDTVAGVLEVPVDTVVEVTGRLESVAEGVVASGRATATAVGTCSRCVEEITMDLVADFQELYAYPDSPTAETSEPEDVPRIVDDVIDLGPLVHDELVLAMPAIPLCTQDCAGLCAQCGVRMDSVGPDHQHEIIDPRWAALVEMLSSDAEDSRGADDSDADGTQFNDDAADSGGGADSDENASVAGANSGTGNASEQVVNEIEEK